MKSLAFMACFAVLFCSCQQGNQNETAIAHDQGGFTPGVWRVESKPNGTFRAVYLATHFMNYYEAAPIEEVKHIEDIGLWGTNTILVHYPTWQFDELTKIYHAGNALSMPIKPPQIK